MTNIYAAIEIGTTRTVLAVGEAETGGRLALTRHAEIPSAGVKKSQIVNIDQATQSVRSVLREIERRQGESGDKLTIGNAFLVITGQHVKADPFQGLAQVEGGKVGVDDIEEVVESSRGMPMPNDRETLDVVDQFYRLDSLVGITSPKGLSGRVLKLDVLHIHADANRIKDAHTAADAAHLELRDPLFAVTCAADAVLSDAERRDGVMVLDLGGGSTGYAVYDGGRIATANVFGVGGDHVTNDIAYAFQTTQAQAEELKRREASAVVGQDRDASARVKIPGASALVEAKTVSRHALETVVNLRMKEMLTMIRQDLEARDLLHRLNAGVVLTGGGAAMRGLEQLLQREFGVPVRIGRPEYVDGLTDEDKPWSFAAVAGALMFAHSHYERKSLFDGFFKGLFK